MNRISNCMVVKLCILFFLSAHSAISIYPENITESADQTERSDFQVTISRVEWSHKDQTTVLSTHNIDSIVLPYRFSYLKIDLSVLPKEANHETIFKYAIITSKNKNNWINIGPKDYLILTNLKPGYQTLIVSATVPGQNVDIHPGKLRIIVKTHFLVSVYAIVLYIIAFIILFSAFFRSQTRALRNLTRQFRERERIAAQLMTQKEELALKNKNITDSINYAHRIQSALMPSEKQFKNIFPDSFILHIPRDIVSGDFYWINEIKDHIFIAAVDCTGHGVPGAFVSIIGCELFRKLTNIDGINKPSEILNNLNKDFREVFGDVENITLRDGMDVAFCSLNKISKTLEFAGAFNPLYLIRENSIIEVKGDRNSVGLDHPDNLNNEFTNHNIQLQTGDIIYMFSDGFADQFGGPEGKKYKYRRFRHLLLALHHLPMNRQHDFLHRSITEWKGNLDQVDDILVIGLKINF
ncbi:MAG: SpoIIE family protein phosphatase [Bacteroidales bacterium]|nr:SpoIIE family protein phosphatase [Bacteroidales bacterium]